ncbi:MAG: flagella basal body P-ring formation protein FlgA [Phycisphaerae bacterium]|nr:flagella basal body P-ring formation protein FlgA [Phycisphaerae bacterium]
MLVCHRTIFTVAASLAVAAAAMADSIVLKSVTRLDRPVERVTLADIAYLDGPDAEALASTVVADARGMSGEMVVPIDQVRDALSAAGAKLGLIDLSGHETRVQFASSDQPRAMKGMSVDDSLAPRPPAGPSNVERGFLAASALGTTTPRGLLAQMLVDVHAGKRAEMRIIVEGADNALLDARGPHRYELVPLASLSSDRIAMRIIERDADSVVARHEVVVLPLLRRDVAVATRAIRRNEPLESAIEIREEWLSPSDFARFATVESALVANAMDSLAAGERVPASKVRKPIEIKKNDRVVVRREVGLVAIEIPAVAVSDGAVGDVIELRVIDRKDRKAQRTFSAVVVGPGRAEVREGV